MNASFNLAVIAPAIVLALTGFVIVALDLFFRPRKSVILGIAIVGLCVSLFYTLNIWGENQFAFDGLVAADNFALVFNCIFLIAAGLCMLLAMNLYESSYLLYTEFFAIMLFATVGMMLMAAGTNLLTIFLGLETLSISLYVLAGFKRTEERSLESAFKYFLLGAFASGFLLYGMAFVYGATASLDLAEISSFVTNNSVIDNPLLILGGLLIVVGLGFKVAVVPFHMWAPDVYQGAPTPITAFMATGSKAAGFAALLRVLFSATNGTVADWVIILWILSVLTMSVGNIAAIVQSNIKRMLAYSSIAHAGYILVGVVAWNEVGAASVIFYLLAYTFMNVGAFGIISILGAKDKEYVELDDFKGLGFQRPMIAVSMAVFMFSLAGLPPTAGFVGKFYLFTAAVKAGHIPLVIIAVINSMVSLYYYLGVVVAMFMKEKETDWGVKVSLPTVSVSLVLAVVGTLGLGLFPSNLMQQFQLLVNQIL
ncbi:NADH-quinone oxidoreductase subunit N [candidate division KSB1 bacterium]|nr:NADH-quinone oxidoreductase subunit N [candidate division KSB1 bacterium]NIR68400.1 NADH-quinone oxidoreductase subunit N [candidate division KSB1 bacterium]NIS22474.1 NADH-quinone oxidoreductase subunit N [candidate division KSB1 bacterium]NIT69322.1 NADH-quinone oxidoreductase subunit N [candidate division KSB1 bacterium]NIU22979.1 NADH-quinone oxidoreductase subunit N [candidate division KSB1 bacterium]